MGNQELELYRIAKGLAVQLIGMNLNGPAARRLIGEALTRAMATVRRTRPDDEADTISRSVSELAARVTILEDQVSRLFGKLNTAAGVLI